MQYNNTIIKRNRKLRRFFRFMSIYFLLWFVFRYATEIFRNGYHLEVLNEVVFSGVFFAIFMGMFSMYKKQVLYLNKEDEPKVLDWLAENSFDMRKQLNESTVLFTQPKSNRFERHKEVLIKDLGGLIELEFDVKMKEELSGKLPTV